MTEQPNLSQDGVQTLNFIGQAGNQLVYEGPNKKVIMVGVETINRLGTADSHSRKKRPIPKQPEEETWSGSKQNQIKDRQATTKLIEILKQIHCEDGLFSSRRMRKRETWAEVASQLMEAGFHFRNKDTAWQKVSQKWRNLERTYRAQIASLKGNNCEHAKTMEFFDDLHELLAQKYNADESVADETSSIGDADETQFDDNGESSQEELTAEMNYELPQTECFDTYVENEILDDKSLVFAPDVNAADGLPFNPHTSDVRDPVLRLMLEMRAQERAHFREDRRERLKLQREMHKFQKDLFQMLNEQHQERMDAMYALISAIKGVDDKKNYDFKRVDKTSLELNLPNGKRKRRHSDNESSSSQSSSQKSIR